MIERLSNSEVSLKNNDDFVVGKYDIGDTSALSQINIGAAELVLPFITARKVRIQLLGIEALNLAEVQVIDTNGENRALSKPANQTSTYASGGRSYPPGNAVNGIISSADFTSTTSEEGAAWEVDLEDDVQVVEVIVYNRVACCKDRLSNSEVSLINNASAVVGKYGIDNASALSKITIVQGDFL